LIKLTASKVVRSMTPNFTKQTILFLTIGTNEVASPFLATHATIDRSFAATILTIRAQGAAVPPLIALPAPKMKTDPTSRPWRGPNKGPLTSIRVPNDPQRRGSSRSCSRGVMPSGSAPTDAVAESVKRLAVPVLLDADEAAAFDLMEVQLTVYGLTGVVASRKEGRNSNRRKPNRFFSKRQQPPTTQPTTTSTSTSTLEAASASIGTSQSLTSHESYEMPADDGVPVTAVVSFQRNAISSTTSLETFLPSQPLVASSSIRPGSSYRYQASWMRRMAGNEIRATSSKSSESDKDACTFKVIRTMRRENYRPGLSIEDVSNYTYETVDLNVLVGHRQDLVSLGVASLVITGEEEGEHVMKIPVRQSAQKVQHNKGSGKGKGKGSSVTYFPHDPEWRYSLEENATLCVGVRVVPLPSVGSSSHSRDENNSCADAAAAPPPARHHHPQQRPKTKSKKKSNDAAATSNDVIIEVNDEAMLLAQLCRTDDSDDKKKQKGAKRPSRSDAGGAHDGINHTCTGVGVGGVSGAATSSPGLALMTMLPQGMLCVPASVSASCVDAASHHQAYHLPQEVRDYLLPAHPKDHRKNQKAPMRDVVGGAGSRRNHAATRTAASHLPASSLLSTLSASTDGSLTEIADRRKGRADGGERSCAATSSSFADSHLLSVQRMIEANLHAMHAKLGASRTPAPAPAPPRPPPAMTTTKPTTAIAATKSNPAAAAAPAATSATAHPGRASKVKQANNNNNNTSRRPDHPAHRTLEV
jgi:hypothetical protein